MRKPWLYRWWRPGPPFIPQSLVEAIRKRIGFMPLMMWGRFGTPIPHKVKANIKTHACLPVEYGLSLARLCWFASCCVSTQLCCHYSGQPEPEEAWLNPTNWQFHLVCCTLLCREHQLSDVSSKVCNYAFCLCCRCRCMWYSASLLSCQE